MGALKLVEQKNFNNVSCAFYSNEERAEVWMTRKQIGEALDYSQPNNAIKKIHSRHKDRFENKTRVAQIDTPLGGKQKTTIYNRKGMMEICRHSRKPKADDFMDWVWDIIDEIMITGSYSQVEQQIKLKANSEEEANLMRDIHSLQQMVDRDSASELMVIELERKKDRLKDLKEKQELKRDVESAKEQINNIKENIIETSEDWRKWVNDRLNKIGFQTKEYKGIRTESYDLLEDRARCRLGVRLDNLKERLREQGATKTKIDNTRKLDVIEQDTRLKEIYTAIVKELAVKYSK